MVPHVAGVYCTRNTSFYSCIYIYTVYIYIYILYIYIIHHMLYHTLLWLWGKVTIVLHRPPPSSSPSLMVLDQVASQSLRYWIATEIYGDCGWTLWDVFLLLHTQVPAKHLWPAYVPAHNSFGAVIQEGQMCSHWLHRHTSAEIITSMRYYLNLLHIYIYIYTGLYR